MVGNFRFAVGSLNAKTIMFSGNHLFAALGLFLLTLLGFWGGGRLLKRFRRRSPGNLTGAPVTPPTAAEKQLAAAESKLLRTYFRGLSYVLANETDKAVAEFVKVAQVNTTTAEIYLALGQLYRNSGEVERAIRVHRDILLRPNLPDDVRRQTFFEIGLDYKKAGFLDRACRTFEEILEHNPSDQASRKQLSSIYVSMREWEKALSLYKDKSGSRNDAHIIAHLTTEVAKNHARLGAKDKALVLFKKAIKLDGKCVDVWLHYGDFLLQDDRVSEALAAWEKAFLINPEFVTQVVERIEKIPAAEKDVILDDFFQRHQENYGGLRKFNLAYINRLINSGKTEAAGLQLKQELASNCGDGETFSLVKRLLRLMPAENSEQNHIQSLVEDLIAADFSFEKRYYCRKCGFKLDRIACKCPRCSSWDSITVR